MLPEGSAEGPLDSVGFFLSAPFVRRNLDIIPQDNPAFISNLNIDNITGDISWNLDSNPDAAVNVTISATMGSFFAPVVGNEIWPFPGTATVQINTSGLKALGFASAQFLGSANATATIGFMIQEFDQSGNSLGIAQEGWQPDLFDLNVTFGQTQRADVELPSTSQSISFPTTGSHFYLIWFWLLSEIQANVAGGLWGSRANTDLGTTLTSISGVWTPVPLATVPDVIGLAPATARAKIERAGFQVAEYGDPIVGNFTPYVELQDPDGGTVEPVNTTVNITIATPVQGGGNGNR